jgi:hypothetical protein
VIATLPCITARKSFATAIPNLFFVSVAIIFLPVLFLFFQLYRLLRTRSRGRQASVVFPAHTFQSTLIAADAFGKTLGVRASYADLRA